MNRFCASDRIITDILTHLKQTNHISPDAHFNPQAPGGLRREVTYRDSDFLYFLGKAPREELLGDELIRYLKEHKLVATYADYDRQAFLEYRREVKAAFKGTWTSITPVMERIMYILTSLRRPRRLVECGSFWGNTLAWFAGPCLGKTQQYKASSITGIDLDQVMCRQAEQNFAGLANTERVRIIQGDAKDILPTLASPIDFLYLEAKSDKEPDLYTTLLRSIDTYLSPGCWIIAHDIYDKDQLHHLQPYLNYVRDTNNFSFSTALDVDFCGMELTIK